MRAFLFFIILQLPWSLATAQIDSARPEGDSTLPKAGIQRIIPEDKLPSKSGPDKFKKSKLTNDSTEATTDRRALVLSPGEETIVDLDFEMESGQAGIFIGNDKILGVFLVVKGESKKQLSFKPISPGETTVSIRDPQGAVLVKFDVVINNINLARKAAEMKELLRDVEGVEVKVVGPNIVVDGELINLKDYGRVAAVVFRKPYVDFSLMLATIAPIAIQVLAKRIENDMKGFAPTVTTRVVNGTIFLEGNVDSKDAYRQVEEITSIYLPDMKPGDQASLDASVQVSEMRRPLIKNLLTITPPEPKKAEKLVRMSFYFVELSKDYNRTFGFRWAPGFTSDPSIGFGQQTNGQVGSSATTFTATLSSLFPTLQNAQTAGFARVLKQGNIIIRSGKEGTIEDKLSIPTVSTGVNGASTVTPNDIGLSVFLRPQIVGQSEDISIDIDAKNSSVAGQAGVATISATRAVKTSLYLKSGESAAIGGLEYGRNSTDFNKDGGAPPAASNPAAGVAGAAPGAGPAIVTAPIFNLQRSKAQTRTKTQFVLFLTPEILEAASQGSEELKRNFRVKVR